MQDFTPEMCETLGQATEKYVTLYDKRDNIAYRVGYLADGRCWMLDNLSLDITNVSLATLQGNTNASNATLNYLKNGGGTTSDQWATAGVSKAWTSRYSYSAPLIAVDSATSGVCSDATTWCVSSDGTWSWNTITPATINNTASYAQGKLGVYYNYCAASAGSYCWGDGTSYAGSPSSDPDASTRRDVAEDICPYGWRMPTSSVYGEYNALYGQYSGSTPSQTSAFQVALSTPLSGYFSNGKAYYHGDSGTFWSSTWYNNQYMYYLLVNATSVDPNDAIVRRYGQSVRCLVDN
jgi:uncharacterized protein (TIGR02145 family)